MTKNGNLGGLWQSFYRFASSGRAGDEFWGRHILAATQSGNMLHLESVPNSKSQVVLELELSADARKATGTWREQTDPTGYYKGVTYEGTIELEVTEDGQRMSGFWHGKGSDGEMNTDVWELTKNDVEQPAE